MFFPGGFGTWGFGQGFLVRGPLCPGGLCPDNTLLGSMAGARASILTVSPLQLLLPGAPSSCEIMYFSDKKPITHE